MIHSTATARVATASRGLTTIALASTLVVGACGGDGGTGPGATFQSIDGAYAGAMAGTSQGIDLNSTFTLTISQNQGDLSGTWGLSGVLDDGINTANVVGTGTLTGAIAPGNNPSVNLTVRAPSCPNYQATFSGAYDVANRRLTITGPVEFFAANTCTVVLTYATTIILNR